MHTVPALESWPPVAPPAPRRAPSPSPVVLRVDFRAGDEVWSAIGGGETVSDAIYFAHASLPEGPSWRMARFRPVYGE